MTEPRRFGDSWPVMITSALATFALVHPSLLWGAAAGDPPAGTGARAALLAAVTSLGVAAVAGRASVARDRWRAFAWMMLAFVPSIGAIVASWFVLKSDADLVKSLALVLVQLVLLPWGVELVNMPVVLSSVGRDRARGPAHTGVAATLALAGAYDVAVICNPLVVTHGTYGRTAPHNPSTYLLPEIVWLEAIMFALGAVVLFLAARSGSISKGRRLVAWGLSGSFVTVGTLVAVLVFHGAWRRIPTDTNAALFGATRASDGSVWIVGQRGTVLKLASGATTKPETIVTGVDVQTDLYAVCTARERVWIVGSGELVLRSDDGGRQWVVEHTTEHGGELRGVWCDADGASLAVGRSGTILRRTPSGAWDRRPVDVSAQTLFTGATGAGRDRYVVSFDGPLLRSDDAGETFAPIAPGSYGGGAISIGPDGTLWRGSALVQRSTDRGLTFGPSGTSFDWLPVLSVSHPGSETRSAFAHVDGKTFVSGTYLMRVLDGGARLVEEKAYDAPETFGLAVDGAGRVIAVGELGALFVLEHP